MLEVSGFLCEVIEHMLRSDVVAMDGSGGWWEVEGLSMRVGIAIDLLDSLRFLCEVEGIGLRLGGGKAMFVGRLVLSDQFQC